MNVEEEIRQKAGEQFDPRLLEEFILKYVELSEASSIIDRIVRISTDEGIELEVGFFTKTSITDITLSGGKVYSMTYPIDEIHSIEWIDAGKKWTLQIRGPKKLDYNIVKPGTKLELENYERSLRQLLKIELEA